MEFSLVAYFQANPLSSSFESSQTVHQSHHMSSQSGLSSKDMGIGWTDLCIDRLQVWADKSCLHRFDRFNNK